MAVKQQLSTDSNTLVKDFFHSVGRVMRVKKEHYLFEEGLSSSEIYFVKSGKFQITKSTPDGKELLLSIVSSGELLGDFSLFNQNAKHNVNAMAMDHSELYVVDYVKIESQILKGGEFAAELFKLLNLFNKRNESKFRDLLLYGKKGALYSTLIRLSNSYRVIREDGILLDIKLTNSDLANFCGTARESISRLLSEIRNQGIISIENGKILIHNIKFIKKEINCENCPVEICSIR